MKLVVSVIMLVSPLCRSVLFFCGQLSHEFTKVALDRWCKAVNAAKLLQ
jgi:hypothetical protein